MRFIIDRISLALLFCWLFITNAHSQNESIIEPIENQKNEIRFQYSFGYTKTNFDETLEGWIDFPSSSFLEKNPPIYPVLGYGIGISFGRKISTKNKISLFVNRSAKGQKSDVFYNYFGFPDTTNIREGYGGVSYHIKYYSNEFGVELAHRIFEKKELNLKSNLNFRLSADVYDEIIFRNFILDRKTGIIGQGCCLTVLYHSDSNRFRRFTKNLSNQYFRIGIGVSIDFDFYILKDLAVSFRPQVQYFSSLVASSDDPNIKSRVIKNGTIYSAQMLLGLTYKI